MPSQRSRDGAFATSQERRFPHCGTDDLQSVAAGPQTNDSPVGQVQV
jgi:hypothetical protein